MAVGPVMWCGEMMEVGLRQRLNGVQEKYQHHEAYHQIDGTMKLKGQLAKCSTKQIRFEPDDENSLPTITLHLIL